MKEGGELCDPHEMAQMVREDRMDALDRITRCYGQRLLAVSRSRCRSEEDARDAVQDALLSAGSNLQTWRGDGSLEGWLVRMVINACHRMRRGRKNDPELHRTDVPVETSAPSPEERAARGQIAEALGQALLTLPPRDRVVLLLAEGEGWTGPEIARELDLTPGAVRTRLTRIRKKLRAELETVHRELDPPAAVDPRSAAVSASSGRD